MLIALILSTIAFCIIAMLVFFNKTQNFDHRLLNRKGVDESKSAKKTLTAMRDITAFGGDIFSILFAIIILCLSIAIERVDIFYSLLVFAIPARLLGLMIKMLFPRKRPDISLQKIPTHTSSFPSIHTMMATVNFGWLGFIMPMMIPSYTMILPLQILCASLIFFIGYSRHYLAVHWVSDILAGWFAGCAILLCGYLLTIA